jgi:hypothetical protein
LVFWNVVSGGGVVLKHNKNNMLCPGLLFWNKRVVMWCPGLVF